MICKKIRVHVKDGFHLRPVELLCNKTLEYECTIQIIKGDRIANAKSFLSVLACQIQEGDLVEFTFDGKDEEQASIEVIEFIQQRIQE